MSNCRRRPSHISLYACHVAELGWRDPRWRRRRCEKFRAARGHCEGCAHQRARVVHHKHYITGRAPWDYADDELEALCHECHWRRHNPPTPNPAQLRLFTQEELGPLFHQPSLLHARE